MVTSAELAATCRTSLSIIHSYTLLGLLLVRGRRGNKRLYDLHEATNRLRAIQRLRHAGYPLHLIREQLSRGRRGYA